MNIFSGFNLFRILFVIIFITDLFISTISNYKPYSFLLKGLLSIIIFVFIIIDIRLRNLTLRTLFSKKEKEFFLIITVLTILPLLTLLYSANPSFGFQKWLYIIISVIPAVICLHYLFIINDEDNEKIFVHSFVIIGSLFSILTILLHPFEYSSVYSFNITRWSHILSGKFLTFSSLIIMLTLIKEGKTKNVLFYSSLLLLNLTAVYFTGSRAAIFGAVIFILLSLFILVFVHKITFKIFITGAAGFIIAALLIYLIFDLDIVEKRITDFILNLRSGEFTGYALQTRKEAFEAALDIFKQNPVFGIGFGGYNIPNNDFLSFVKYPHNIFLETAAEFGAAGLILLIALQYIIIKHSYNFSMEFMLLILLALWFSLTSKDIATNTFIWIGIAAFRSSGR